MTTRPTPRRKAVLSAAVMTVTFALGVGGAVFVARPAAASPPSTACPPQATTTMSTVTDAYGVDPNSPEAHFSVLNGTADAASDHEILGSSAFPNYTTGAVDNYYSLSKAHVDNSPFAEATASPFDTGPVGQTAAAGNTQQPQYADARWPGDTCHAEYGSKGGPDAVANVGSYDAKAKATEGENNFAVPNGFNSKLQRMLAAWKAKYLGAATGKSKTPTVTTPKVTVPTPVTTVTTPTVTLGGPLPATPPLKVPSAPAPAAPGTTLPTRTLSASSSGGTESFLTSSTMSTLDTSTKLGKFGALVTSGESTLGRVSIGGGLIVLKGIHVTASITNNGTSPTPAYTADISVGSASIAGVPVTIDQHGVHVATQKQALPYKQASDALNSALKQAGIQIYLVSPQVSTISCGQPGGTGTSTDTTSTTTTSTDQSGMGSSCGCPPAGASGTGTDTTSTTTTSTDPSAMSTTPASCACPPGGGTGTDTTTTGGSTTPSAPGTSTTTSTTTTDQSSMSSCGCPPAGGGTGTTTDTTTTSTTTTSTTSTDQSTSGTMGACDQSGMPPATGDCAPAGAATGPAPSGPTAVPGGNSAPAPSPFDAPGGAGGNSVEEILNATGVHVVFTQPVDESGVPAQFAEHILGQVYLDSLAGPLPLQPKVDTSLTATTPSASPASSTCGGTGGKSHTSKSGGGIGGGSGTSASGGGSTGGTLGSTAGGSSMSGAGGVPASGSSFGSGAQPTSASTGGSFPATLASALKKPLWLLLAYLVWQVLVIGTGASLWNWRRGDEA